MKKEIKTGIATAAVLFVWLFGGFYLAGSLQLGSRLGTIRALAGLLGMVILFIGVLLGIRQVKDENPTITYWQAVKTGVIISLTVAVVISIAATLHYLLNPHYAADMIKEAEQSLMQSNVPPEQMAQKMASVRLEYSFGMQMMQPLVAQSVAGSLFSLILAFFFKEKK